MKRRFHWAALHRVALYAAGIAALGVPACDTIERPEPDSPATANATASLPCLQSQEAEPAEQLLLVLPEPAQAEAVAESPIVDAELFKRAAPILLTEAAPVVVEGRVESAEDVLLWNAGRFEPGHVINVELLDAIEGHALVALFDEDHDLVQLGVLRSPGGIPGQSQVTCGLFAPTDTLYLAVYAKAGPPPEIVRLQLTRARQDPIPVAAPPRIVLNFDGAENVTLGTREGIRVEPFRAERVDPRYEGETESIRYGILDAVQKDFEAFGIDVTDLAAVDDVGPDDRVVHLGGTDLDGLGAAGSQAVVNTNAFDLLAHLDPTPGELAQAIANVASHEAGHLLGLNHTLDPADIMNPTASPADRLLDQTFRHAPLDPRVFPIGAQDGAKWIAARLGTADSGDTSDE